MEHSGLVPYLRQPMPADIIPAGQKHAYLVNLGTRSRFVLDVV
jgi:hypothetical protein